MWQKIFFLAMAGAFGALSRYGIAEFVQRRAGAHFPFGTMAVNLLGCFLAGLIISLAAGRLQMDPELRLIILVGFMGAFTTFSTYIFETSELLKNGQWVSASINVLLQNTIGIIAIFTGLFVGRSV